MIEQSLQLPDAIRKATNLPSLPSVALEVLRLSKDPDAGISDLAKAISTDPALSAKIIKLANSPSYRRGRDITSLAQATSVLGMKTLKLLALSFSLARTLPRSGESTTFDFGHYWRRSLATAVAARDLARLVKDRYGDEAFLCGLLSRVGQLVMATTIGDQYEAVLGRSRSTLPTTFTEREVLGYDFHLVGEALLRSWNLPELLAGSVGSWDSDLRTVENADILPLCRLLQTADSMSVLIYEDEKGTALRQVHELGLNHFGLSEEEIDTFIVTLQDEVGDTAASLDIDEATSANDYERIVEEARDQVLQIGLGAIADLKTAQDQAVELKEANIELDIVAKTDRLTQLANRASFDHKMEEAVEARLKGDSSNSLGVLIIDIDHFKSFNDTYGHVVGDTVLKTVARRLKGATWDTDFIARYGGEEFVAILPNTTLADLESVAERLRQTIEDEEMEHDGTRLQLTISLGGACVTKVTSVNDGKALVELADECLYEAKDAGRNRWICRDVQLVST